MDLQDGVITPLLTYKRSYTYQWPYRWYKPYKWSSKPTHTGNSTLLYLNLNNHTLEVNHQIKNGGSFWIMINPIKNGASFQPTFHKNGGGWTFR